MQIQPGICTLHGNPLAVISFNGVVSTPECVRFNVGTYKNLKLSKGDGGISEYWDDQFGYANGFIETLSLADKVELAKFYIAAAHTLHETNFLTVTEKLSILFQDIAHTLQLPHRLNAYVITANIHVPDLSHVGTRAHDTDEMTFREPEYVQLIAICVMCKLFCPIWGEFIHMSAKDIDTASKELYCMSMIDQILSGPVYGRLRSKFRNFIVRIMESDSGKRQVSKQDSRFVSAVGGYSADRLDDSMYAIMLVRKFANVKLHECDLMRYVHVSVSSTTTARGVALRQQNIFVRVDPPKENDSQAQSVIEHESITSVSTADTPHIARYGALQIIRTLLETHKIPQSAYNAAMEHYKFYPLLPNIYSHIVISTIYGTDLGGAASIDYLDAECYTGLVTAVQILLLNKHPSHLIHLLSAHTRVNMTESDIPIENVSIMNNFKNSGVYKQIEASYPYSIEQTGVQRVLQELCDWTCGGIHHYNTPPALFDLLDEEVIHPGDTSVVYPRSVMIDMGRLIIDICKIV